MQHQLKVGQNCFSDELCSCWRHYSSPTNDVYVTLSRQCSVNVITLNRGGGEEEPAALNRGGCEEKGGPEMCLPA